MKNKLMKIILCTALFTTITPNVLAQEVLTDEGSTDIDVMSNVEKGNGLTDGNSDYYMVLSWESTGANYIQNATYVWDAANMQYKKNGSESTSTTNDAETTITVTNNSNGKIKYNITYTTAEGFDTAETPVEGYEAKVSGKLTSAVPSNYVIPNTSLSEYTGFTAQSSTYKGTVKLNNYTGAGVSTKIGTYTVTLAKSESVVLPSGETVADLEYTGTAEKGGKITIGGKQFTVLSNENGVIRAMADENLGNSAFSSTRYWDDAFNNGTLKKYDSIDLTHSDNLIRPMLDAYAVTLGIDKTSVTLPTYEELNALTENQRSSSVSYWTRSLGSTINVVYFVYRSGDITDIGYVNTNYFVRPVVILAA